MIPMGIPRRERRLSSASHGSNTLSSSSWASPCYGHGKFAQPQIFAMSTHLLTALTGTCSSPPPPTSSIDFGPPPPSSILSPPPSYPSLVSRTSPPCSYSHISNRAPITQIASSSLSSSTSLLSPYLLSQRSCSEASHPASTSAS